MGRHHVHRKDANHDAVVSALRSAGVLVRNIGEPCDLLCRVADRYFLLDVDGITKYRKRDPAQLVQFELWRVQLVKTPEEALEACGL